MFSSSKILNLPSLFLIGAFMISFATSSFSAEKTPFSLAQFEQLKSQGKVVLVDVYADWCSTCKKQQKAFKAYFDKHPERDLHVLEVDFDKQKDVVTMLGAPRQSTLLLFKGNHQFWFSVAETRPQIIESKIEQAFDFVPKKRKS